MSESEILDYVVISGDICILKRITDEQELYRYGWHIHKCDDLYYIPVRRVRDMEVEMETISQNRERHSESNPGYILKMKEKRRRR